MKKKFIVLWMILLLAVTACSQKIPESEKATLHLNVHFEKNWIFSKYDVDVLIDDKRVGSIDHGDDYEKDITIHNGDHSLTFRKHNNKKVYGSLSFSIDRLTSISCTIHAYHDEVDITDVEVLTYEEFNSAPIASFAISDIIVNKDESRSIGYETNPSEVIIKNEKVSVEDRSVATASFKNHLLTVKGIDEGQTKATIELTDAHGNTMKKVINITVNLTEEQLEQKQEEEAALRAVQEEEEKAQKEKEKKEAEAKAAKEAKKAKKLAKVKKELGSNYNLAFVLKAPNHKVYYLINTKKKIIRQVGTDDTGVMYAKYKGSLTKGVTFTWKCVDGYKETIRYKKNAKKLKVHFNNGSFVFKKCSVKEAEKALYKIGNYQLK